MMKLRNLKLVLANVAGKNSAGGLLANGVSELREKDENGKYTKLIGYAVECAVNRGDSLKVKFPLSIEQHFLKLKEMLDADMIVEIGFTNLKLTPYALKAQDGSVLSGVSAKADDFTIISSNADNIDLSDIDI